jgi:hypothetical protein
LIKLFELTPRRDLAGIVRFRFSPTSALLKKEKGEIGRLQLFRGKKRKEIKRWFLGAPSRGAM